MRLSDRGAGPDVTGEDIARVRARSPMARQLCDGSNRQLMQDAGTTVVCPKCLREFTTFDEVRNREQRCPVVPSHLPDHEGVGRVALAEAKRSIGGPRPY